MNEGDEYTRAELSWILGEPFVRGVEMMSGDKHRRLISMEFGDEIKGKTEEDEPDAERS